MSGEHDPVNHPSHYCTGGIECSDAIAAALANQEDPMQAWLTGQVIKYLWRWPQKGGKEDLEKARFYLNRLIDSIQEEGKSETEKALKSLAPVMESLEHIVQIERKVPRIERLVQLSEECAELAKAALKLRRALGGGTPTPVAPKEAEAALLGELSDVYACIMALGYDDLQYTSRIDETVRRKLRRWAERLEAAEEG